MISAAIIISFVVIFIHECTRPGMIFGFASEWDVPIFLRKPLYDCPTCMCPWWGSVIILLLQSTGWYVVTDVVTFLLPLLMAGGINATLMRLTGRKPCDCDRKNRLKPTDDDR